MNPKNKLAEMPIRPLLYTMAVPLMLSLLIQSLYNIVDSIFVARLSEKALTAASLVYAIQFLMIAIGVGTAVGLNALLSRKLGQKKPEEACRAHHLGDLPVCGHHHIVRLLCLRSWQRRGQYDRRCLAAAGGAGALPVASHPHHGHRKSVVCVLGVRGDRLRLQPVGNEKRTAEQGKVRQNKKQGAPPGRTLPLQFTI